uniref:alpha-glucosidase n=1 Tax=Plectus sambesii TaxID=2011161 RepID=A0A914WQE2_9BILA
MAQSEPLMPGPEGKIPKLYDVEKGHKTESYIVAISGRKEKGPVVPVGRPAPLLEEAPPVAYKTVTETVVVRTTPATVGLTRDQLEQYRDDPFWKPLRWILFILFWLAWIVMFLVAILIVFLSPSCAPKTVQKWYQTKVCYQAWTPSLQDSNGDGVGDLKGATSRLEQLRKIGVQSFWLTPLLDSDQFSYAIRNHRAVDGKLGTSEDLTELIDTLHDKDMYMIMDLPVTTTSLEHEWFQRSSRASEPANQNYSSFYFWRATAPNDQFWSPLSAGVKDNFYMHYEGKPQWPILNWKSPELRQQMFDVFTYWLERGVDGFFISYVDYLGRTNDGTKPDSDGIQDVLRDIRHHIDTRKNETDSIKDKAILLFTTVQESKEKDKLALVNAGLNTVINYELGKVKLGTSVCPAGESTVTKCVNEILADVVAVHNLNEDFTPMWEFGNPFASRLASRVGSRSQAEVLTMLQLLLPGSNNFYYGEEIGMRDLTTGENPQRGAMLWDDSVNAGFSTANVSLPISEDFKNINFAKQYSQETSQVKMFKKLAKLRQRDDTLILGKSFVGKPVGQAFIFSRYRRENETTIGKLYVGAVNLGLEATSLSLSDIPGLKADMWPKAEVVTKTSNVVDYEVRQKKDLSSGILNIGPEQGVVLRF